MKNRSYLPNIMVLALLFFGATAVSAGPVARHHVAQLDLARQMETTTFVSNWLTRVASLGYDCVRLYLEARVATRTFSLPVGERYTSDEMKAIVRHANSVGIEIIPSLQFYGHAEQFFLHPGIEELSEESCGRYRDDPRKSTFCYANPKTRAFISSYIDDLADIFPAKLWIVGFDEAWNSGLCDICGPKDRKEGGAFLEALLFVRDCLSKHGKRPIIADDFIDFLPGLYERIPKDVAFSHWCYDAQVSTRGTRFNFAGRAREDHLAKYALEGRETMVTVWTKTENVRSYVRYAKRHHPDYFTVAQWEELKKSFHGGSYPRLVAASLLLKEPEKYEAEDAIHEAARRTFPSLRDVEIDAVATLIHSEPPLPPASVGGCLCGFPRIAAAAADRMAVDVLRASALRPSSGEVDPEVFSERAFLDDLVMRGEIGLVDEDLRRVVPMLTDPRRTIADVRAAKDVLRKLVPEVSRLIARRDRQHDLWRPGCSPRIESERLRKVRDLIGELLARPDAVASPVEKRLYVDLILADYYGQPQWVVEGRFSGGWRKLGGGIWKPGPRDEAAFTRIVDFKSDVFPDALRVSYTGYGQGAVAYLAIEDRERRVFPRSVLKTFGKVTGAQALLTDDLSVATFGSEGFVKQFADQRLANAASGVEIELTK